MGLANCFPVPAGALHLFFLLKRAEAPRFLLVWMWRVVGRIYVSFGVIYFAYGILATAAAVWDSILLSTIVIFWVNTLNSFTLGGLALRPSFRRQVHLFLGSRGEGVSKAAGISVLIGGENTKNVRSRGLEKFRSITLDKLSREEMASNDPIPALYERSSAVTSGRVDAFLSHSWHDDAPLKWDALQRWRKDFLADNGREPTLWIDKASLLIYTSPSSAHATIHHDEMSVSVPLSARRRVSTNQILRIT